MIIFKLLSFAIPSAKVAQGERNDGVKVRG